MSDAALLGTGEKNWVTLFRQYENITELSRRVLMSLVDKIFIYENRAIEIVFRYKDEFEKAMECVLACQDILKAS